ncbi:MAG: aldo/keto reductase [Methanomassiliicoccales archaeon]|nr:aldo/keto reductase [Methanomassiliicoccales archaeon]
MKLTIGTRFKLNNGVEMPCLGLGTWKMTEGKETREAVLQAFAAGYRMIDTTKVYGNEKEVGEAFRQSGLPREEVFITTKVWNSDHGYQETLNACQRSLRALGMEYVDLYLVHWPGGGRRPETWKAMEWLLKEGKCRAVGVSNYTIRHLEEMSGYAEIVPTVNQVEFTPFLYQKDLLDYCSAKRIQVEAYSPLTHGKYLENTSLKSIAIHYRKSVAQVLIRWGLQHGTVEIPKSKRRNRIIENAGVFDFQISARDMRTLDLLDAGMRTAWNPEEIP